MKLLAPLFIFFLAVGGGLAGCARNHDAAHAGEAAPAQDPAPPLPSPAAVAAAERAEQIRAECIEGRRLVCGRVLNVFTNGLVVDSGYTDLLRSPLGQSWVIPGTASAVRDPNVLELNEPGCPCIGLVFLTDVPKRQKVKKFDYVVLIGYPAGQYVYAPVPEVKKTIRKFAGGLGSAVRLKLQDAESDPRTNAPIAK